MANTMKIIAVMGDSHTWGEGVGAEYGFRPRVVCADKRMSSFGFPHYVNLLRDAVNLYTKSDSKEYDTDDLAALCGEWEDMYGVLSPDRPVQVHETFGLARMFFVADKRPADVTVSVDGTPVSSAVMQSDTTITSASVRLLTVHVPDGAHTLTVTSASRILFHRIELYTGPYAVVNCGIGSCPVGQYTERFFKAYIADLQPYAVVFEGCTINDWLTGETPETYGEDITRAIEMLRSLTPRILGHTVFPIGGSQVWGQNPHPYGEYVDAMRKALQALGVPCVDCNRIMTDELNRIPDDSRVRFMYHDPWHPNGTGHYLYARSLWRPLCNLLHI